MNGKVTSIEEFDRAYGRKDGPPRPRTTRADEIVAMHFDPIKYVVPGYIAEGCSLLAGTPKLGKSWMVLEMALAVAAGGACLGGIDCEPGAVLYLALEDNLRRLRSRIRKVWSLDIDLPNNIVPDRLHFATEWPRANVGGIEAIRAWLAEHTDARLVIVDVLAMFKAISGKTDQTQYEADYLAVKALQEVASDTGVAIVIVHHTRKGAGDLDPFEAISGTLGLSGAADTGLVLRRDGSGVTLYGRGRDIEEIETAVTFDRVTCRWTALGAASEVRRTDERTIILDALFASPDPMSPTELADVTSMSNQNVRQMLHRMVKDGDVLKLSRGSYAHPSKPHVTSVTRSQPDD
jgi:hypothetical protein